MITQLIPGDIARQWPSIGKRLLYEPVKDEARRSSLVLSALLSGKMQLWEASTETGEVFSRFITYVGTNPLLSAKCLHFITLIIEKQVGIEVWRKAFEEFSVIAKGLDCSYIMGGTDNKVMARIVRSLGGSISYSVMIDLENRVDLDISKEDMKEILV